MVVKGNSPYFTFKTSSIIFVLLLLCALRSTQQYSFGRFSTIKWNLIPHNDVFAIYIRIVGNDLPPRHDYEQTIRNMKFILDHEPDFSSLKIYKFWILNRMFDVGKRKRIEMLLTEYGQAYGVIPFHNEEYLKHPFDMNKFPISDFLHSPLFLKMSSSMRLNGVDYIYHSKNLYAINNNGGRNVAIELGKAINATWTMVFDGNCFMASEPMHQLGVELRANIENFSDSPSYFVLPMVRMLNNSILLDEEKIKAVNSSSACDEPQIIFRIDSNMTFNPNLRYGRRPKLDLLWRLGFPRNATIWKIHPWEEREQYNYHDYRPILFKRSKNSWVARLFSGNRIQELSSKESGKLRNVNRIKGILSFINNISSSLVDDYLLNWTSSVVNCSKTKKLPPLMFNLTKLDILRAKFEMMYSALQLSPLQNKAHFLEHFQQVRFHFYLHSDKRKDDVLDAFLTQGHMALQSCLPIPRLSRLLLSNDVCQYLFNSQFGKFAASNAHSLVVSAAILAVNYYILQAEIFRVAAFTTINEVLHLESLNYLSDKCMYFLHNQSLFDDFSPIHRFGIVSSLPEKDLWSLDPFCFMFEKEVSEILLSVPLFLVLDIMSLLDMPINNNVSLLISYWIRSSHKSIGIPSSTDAALAMDIHSPLSPLPVWITLPLRPDKNVLYDMNLFSSIYYGGRELGSLESLAYASMSRFSKKNLQTSSNSQLPSFPIRLTSTAQKLNYSIMFDAETGSVIYMERIGSLVRESSYTNSKDTFFLADKFASNAESPILAPQHESIFPLVSSICQENILESSSRIYKQQTFYLIPPLYLEQNGALHAGNDTESIFLTMQSSCRTKIQPWKYVNDSSVLQSFKMHGIMMAKMVSSVFPGLFSKIEHTLCRKAGSFCEDMETLRFLVL